MLFDKLRGVIIFVQGLLMFATFAIAFTYFSELAGKELIYELPQIFYPVVGVGVVGVSVITALFHVIGGGIMGATAGGVLMGMKMGLFLGLAYAFGRLWLYSASAFVASALYFDHFPWTTIGIGLATVTFFVVQKVTLFVWGKVESQ